MNQSSTPELSFPKDKSNPRQFQTFLSTLEYTLQGIAANIVRKYFSCNTSLLANDIISDVMIKFNAEYEELDVAKRNIPYLITCIRNKTVDYYRMSKRKKPKNEDVIYINKDSEFFSTLITDSLFSYLNEEDYDLLLDKIHVFASTTKYAKLYEQVFIQRLSVVEIAAGRVTKKGDQLKPQHVNKELERLLDKILEKFKP